MKIKEITGFGTLLAALIVLQIFANNFSFGPVCITLSLIPIVTGAVIFGPWCGAFLGFAMGVCILFAPSTISLFMVINPVGTIIICLTKSTLAGLVAGLIFKIFDKNNKRTLGIIFASIIAPVLNTGLFAAEALIFYYDWLTESSSNAIAYIFTGFIGFNFFIELGINAALSPAVIHVTNLFLSKK